MVEEDRQVMTKFRLSVALITLSALLSGFKETALAVPIMVENPNYGHSPLLFVENQGQYPDDVLFQTIGGPLNLGFTETEIRITLPAPSQQETQTNNQNLAVYFGGGEQVFRGPPARLNLAFTGANQNVSLEPFDPHPAKISYYKGQDPDRWVVGARTWQGVRYTNLYPGLDLEISGTRDGWQFRWQSNGEFKDPIPRVSLSGRGARIEELQPDTAGFLPVTTPHGSFDLPLPASNKTWELEGINADGNLTGLILPKKDFHALVQKGFLADQPSQFVELSYGTFLGGSLWDEANDIAIDLSGNLYLAGHTLSPDFLGDGALAPQLHNVDAFVARIDGATGGLDYLAIFQGADLQNGEEWAMSIAVNPLGDAYVAGRTNSPSFPVTPGAYDTTINGDWDVFALKLNPTGGLVYATFLGGDQLDWGTDLAIDNTGGALLTGGTFSTDFPTSPGAHDPSLNGARDIFLTRLSSDGSELTYSTYIGGTGQDQGEGLALNIAGEIYITGWTTSADFPSTTGAFEEMSPGGFDAFVLKVDLNNPDLLYATYLGGTGEDRGLAIAVSQQDDEAVITGRTNSQDFPTTPNAFASSLAGGTCDFVPCPDAFLVRLQPAGNSMEYGTYLGGSGWDEGRDIAVDGAENVLIAGETRSTDFPTSVDGYDTNMDGDLDGFFSAFALPAFTMEHSSYLGGDQWDVINGIVVDAHGELYLTGKTLSPDFPITPNALAATISGDYDAFAVHLTLARSPELFLPLLNPVKIVKSHTSDFVVHSCRPGQVQGPVTLRPQHSSRSNTTEIIRESVWQGKTPSAFITCCDEHAQRSLTNEVREIQSQPGHPCLINCDRSDPFRLDRPERRICPGW